LGQQILGKFGVAGSERSRCCNAGTASFGPAVVTRLAGHLNGLPAAPNLAMSCPAIMVTYRLTFTGPGVPVVVVSAIGCLSDGITVGGKTQPGLDDPGNGLVAEAGQLLNIGPASHYSGGSRS
jgi:hypothetical protein